MKNKMIYDDLWFFPSGKAQVVLYDLREGSPSKGEMDVYYMGEGNPIMLLIPKGVAHGYRVLGERPATIIYFTTESCRPNDSKKNRCTLWPFHFTLSAI